MDHMNGTELHDEPQPDILGELLDAAQATRPGPFRNSPYDEARQAEADDLELAFEWSHNYADLLADENQGLRLLAKWRMDERVYDAKLHSWLYQSGRRAHKAEARVVVLEIELAALREERDTLAAKLDAANAKLAALENAALVADIGLDDAHEDADDATPATLGDRRQQETRSIEWTPPTRSKPDAAA